MGTLVHDVRYALSTLRRSPWFTAAALATLALGIGATTLVFSVAYGLLVRPLPFPEPNRLVRLWEEHPGGTTANGQRWLSHRTLEAWTTSPRTIEGIAAYRAGSEYTIRLGVEPERVVGAEIAPEGFELLGASPALGRFFTATDAASGTPLAVISDQLWRERFGGAADAIGKSFTIVDTVYTVIGVARPEWRFPDRRVQFWLPYRIPTVAAEPQRTVTFTALARLEADAGLAQVEAEGTAAARSMPRPMSADLMFGKGGPVVVHARRLADDLAAPARPAALVLTAAVACLLLMACANVANLMLSRGVSRRRELAVRAALGGSNARIVRLLLTESLVLSILGGSLGVVLASWMLRLLPAVAPARLPRVEDMHLDWRVLAFAALATLMCAVGAGLVPALRTSRLDLSQAFRGGAGSPSSGRGGGMRDVLLVIESAFAVMLLVGAGLFARSFFQLTRVDAGYSPEQVLAAQIQLPADNARARSAQFVDSVLERLRATPGIVAAGAGNMMPMSPMTAITTFTIAGAVGAPDARTARARTYVITPGYAEALGLRLRAGRLFTDEDGRGGTRSMIVNETFARQYLSDGPVVGRTFGDLYIGEKGTRTAIVGVVADILKDSQDAAPEPEVFVPDRWQGRTPSQQIVQYINLAIRTHGDPAAIAPSVRDLVRSTDGAALVDRLEPLAVTVNGSLAQPRFAARTIGAFALAALLLAAVGLFGVLSYAVAQRQRELGIRAAVGADRRSLISLVLREGLAVTAIGVAVGTIAAAGLTRFMTSALFGVTPLDPLSFAIAPLLLVAVAVLACLGPALRAAAVDPAVTLRSI